MDFAHMWQEMGWFPKGIFLTLIGLSIWSLGIFFERLAFYRAARKESLKYAFQVTNYLKQENIQGAIDEAKKYKSSHLAKVVSAGLLEFQYDKQSGGDAVHGHDVVEAAARAIERATLMTTADFKKGLGVLATIGSTAPFIGLLGTVMGVIKAFTDISKAGGGGGLGVVSGGISEALIETAVGLVVAIPAVWMYNAFTNKIERFEVEMSNSSSELVDFLIKKQGNRR
jgi:biopolymer transport protein ExbB